VLSEYSKWNNSWALISITGGIATVIILIIVGGVFIVKIYGLLVKTGVDIVL